ncbi:MAG: HlyD family secretion protein, partial [Allosphingosinicella sp.]
TRLFLIEPDQQVAQGQQARAELDAAQAQAQDARRGQRPSEIAILEADRDAAEAAAREARIALNRADQLVRRGIYAQVRLDEARAASQSAQARLAAATARVGAATLGQREGAIRAADARVAEARARRAETGERIGDMAPAAPSAGRVEDVFYQRGEWAAANQPIVALIPDDRVWVRFFVPEAQVAAYRPGQQVRFRCDGCPDGLSATIAFVSPRPEFTPPVIYSRESRDRLVFMVEARPDAAARLVPGLPVDVYPIGVRP